mgnify:CR=1 FL=1
MILAGKSNVYDAIIELAAYNQSKTVDVKIQFFRYLFVGGTSFVVDFILLFILKSIIPLFMVSFVICTIIFIITVLKICIRNNATTGEKSSIIPPPSGDLLIIFLIGGT